MSEKEKVRDFLNESASEVTTSNCVSDEDIVNGLLHLYKCVDSPEYYSGCLNGKFTNPWRLKKGAEVSETMKTQSYEYIKLNDTETAYFLKLIKIEKLNQIKELSDDLLDLIIRSQKQFKPLFNLCDGLLFSAYDRDRLLIVKECEKRKVATNSIRKYLYSFDKKVKKQFKLSNEKFAFLAYFLELDNDSQTRLDMWERLCWSKEIKRLRMI